MNIRLNHLISSTDIELSELVFSALSNETRLKILLLLVGGDKSVSELTDLLSARQPVISQQLAILKSAGLVKAKKIGNSRIYAILNSTITIEMT